MAGKGGLVVAIKLCLLASLRSLICVFLCVHPLCYNVDRYHHSLHTHTWSSSSEPRIAKASQICDKGGDQRK